MRPPAVILLRWLSGGGFRLEGEDGSRWEAAPRDDGWRIEESAGERVWVIRAEASTHEKVLLLPGVEGETQELGRATSGSASGSASLLLPDGRLFVLGARTDAGVVFELTGWETPGAYWEATPDAGGWRIERTPAGRDAGLGWEALMLLAAELAPLLRRAPS